MAMIIILGGVSLAVGIAYLVSTIKIMKLKKKMQENAKAREEKVNAYLNREQCVVHLKED